MLAGVVNRRVKNGFSFKMLGFGPLFAPSPGGFNKYSKDNYFYFIYR
jgi:hypothetical protein